LQEEYLRVVSGVLEENAVALGVAGDEKDGKWSERHVLEVKCQSEMMRSSVEEVPEWSVSVPGWSSQGQGQDYDMLIRLVCWRLSVDRRG